jgi:hypothetical protein
MLAPLDEQVVQQPTDRLGGIAVPLVLGRNGEADHDLARVVGVDVGGAVADEPIRVTQGHGELEPLAGRIRVGGLEFPQELARLAGWVGPLPPLVAGDLRVGPVGNEGVQVLGSEATHQQPLGGQRGEGGIDHRLAPVADSGTLSRSTIRSAMGMSAATSSSCRARPSQQLTARRYSRSRLDGLHADTRSISDRLPRRCEHR